MSEKISIQLWKPFGPPVGKFLLGSELINKINKYVDELIEDKEKSKELDAGKNLAGQVNQEISFEKDFCDKNIVPVLKKNITCNYIY